MDIKKVSGFENLNQTEKGKTPSLGGGPSFQDTFNNLQNTGLEKAKPQAGALNQLDGIKFSNHAIERMMSRGIKFSQADLKKLGEAVERAQSKGSKDSLILMNDSALIVSVKNKTVVTVMDKNALKDNVFTNIDSTIVM